jgi:hypothetical protein
MANRERSSQRPSSVLKRHSRVSVADALGDGQFQRPPGSRRHGPLFCSLRCEGSLAYSRDVESYTWKLWMRGRQARRQTQQGWSGACPPRLAGRPDRGGERPRRLEPEMDYGVLVAGRHLSVLVLVDQLLTACSAQTVDRAIGSYDDPLNPQQNVRVRSVKRRRLRSAGPNTASSRATRRRGSRGKDPGFGCTLPSRHMLASTRCSDHPIHNRAPRVLEGSWQRSQAGNGSKTPISRRITTP